MAVAAAQPRPPSHGGSLWNPGRMELDYSWRGQVSDRELNALHAEAFGHVQLTVRWNEQLAARSIGWVIARQGAALVGFVNVIGDGGAHAVLLDTAVAVPLRSRSVGTRLVAEAAAGATAAGCRWLHVDFEDDLAGFYLDACGFRATAAGLLRLETGVH